MSKERFLYLSLEVRDGERKYSCNSVHTIPPKKRIEAFAENYAKDFYGGKSEPYDGGYYYCGGEVHVSVHHYRLITKEEFDILNRFLP
jgi:hypothetical protein